MTRKQMPVRWALDALGHCDGCMMSTRAAPHLIMKWMLQPNFRTLFMLYVNDMLCLMGWWGKEQCNHSFASSHTYNMYIYIYTFSNTWRVFEIGSEVSSAKLCWRAISFTEPRGCIYTYVLHSPTATFYIVGSNSLKHVMECRQSAFLFCMRPISTDV
jgi:hypothetical protein